MANRHVLDLFAGCRSFRCLNRQQEQFKTVLRD